MTSKKIKTIAELSALSAKLKNAGKTVVLCHGVFDLMHPGHIKHIEAAKKHGDILMVTLTPDRFVNKGPGRPVFNQHLRAESIAALAAVDYVAVNEWETAVETIRSIRPNVYVKGSDYAAPEKDVTGGITREKEAMDEVGGHIHFTDEVTFSSTTLLNRFFSAYPPETHRFLTDFSKQNPPESVIDKMQSLSKMRVLLVGDTIIDEYHYCKGMGKSPKDNIISTKFVSAERFPGGVLACANHLAGICGEVHLVTCLGAENPQEEFVLSSLQPKVTPHLFRRTDTCTVVKRRFVDPVFLTKLFEVSYLDDFPLPDDLSRQVCAYLEKTAPEYDMVLVSDFGHGFINGDIINALKKARFLAVNSQTNSANTGYNLITKYPHADYICIDEPEIRLASHSKYGDMKKLIKTLAEKSGARKISITRGHLGALVYDAEEGFSEVPVFSSNVVDRVGAGDAYLSFTAPLVCSGAPMKVAGFVGNAVAALKIGIVCNRSAVSPVALYKFITTLLK